MTTVFDQFANGGNTQFDQLDQPFGVIHTHTELVSLALQDLSTQSSAEVYVHGLVAEITIYDSSSQEHLDAPAAPIHTHSDTVRVTLLDVSGSEHISPTLVHVHAELAALQLVDNSNQVHFPGVGVGVEHIDDQVSRLTLADVSSQAHDLSGVFGVVAQVFSNFENWKASAPSESVFSFPGVVNAQRMTVSVASLSDYWIGGLGPLSGNVRVVVEIISGDNVIPVASLDSSNSQATIFDGAFADSQRYEDIAEAISTGIFTVRVSGYEALPNRSIPLRISGGGTVTVQVSP